MFYFNGILEEKSDFGKPLNFAGVHTALLLSLKIEQNDIRMVQFMLRESLLAEYAEQSGNVKYDCCLTKVLETGGTLLGWRAHCSIHPGRYSADISWRVDHHADMMPIQNALRRYRFSGSYTRCRSTFRYDSMDHTQHFDRHSVMIAFFLHCGIVKIFCSSPAVSVLQTCSKIA